MNNTVIKVLNKEHGKEVIKYWQSLGVNINVHLGIVTLEDYNENGYIYYGLIDNIFDNYNLNQIQEVNAKIIELPTQPNIPEIINGVEMMVSNNNIDWVKKLVICKFNSFYYVKDLYSDISLKGWPFVKSIEKPQIVELTIQDISDGKGVGIAPELIRIKK